MGSPIIVSIRDGCIYAVDNVPSDIVVEVRDYDIQDDESDNIHEDDDGENFVYLQFFEIINLHIPKYVLYFK